MNRFNINANQNRSTYKVWTKFHPHPSKPRSPTFDFKRVFQSVKFYFRSRPRHINSGNGQIPGFAKAPPTQRSQGDATDLRAKPGRFWLSLSSAKYANDQGWREIRKYIFSEWKCPRILNRGAVRSRTHSNFVSRVRRENGCGSMFFRFSSNSGRVD